MITSKQRANLRKQANSYDAIFQIGKGGIGDELIKAVDGALEAREMIKLKVLENCELTAREAAEKLSEAVKCEVVQVIGTKLVLYKQNKNPEKRKIVLDV